MSSPFRRHKGKKKEKEEETTADRLRAILPALQEIHDSLTIPPSELLRLLRPFKENPRYRDYIRTFCVTKSDYRDIARELDALPDADTVSLGSAEQMHAYSTTIPAGARNIISRWLEKRPPALTQNLDCALYQELRYLLGSLCHFDLQQTMLNGIARVKAYLRDNSFEENILPIFSAFELFFINYAMIPRRMAAPQSVRRAPLLEVQKALIAFCLLIYKCLTPEEKETSLITMPWLDSWEAKSIHYTWVDVWTAKKQSSPSTIDMGGEMPAKNKLELVTLDLHQLFLNTYHQRCTAVRYDPQDTISQTLLPCIELSRKWLLVLSESTFTLPYTVFDGYGNTVKQTSFWEQALAAITAVRRNQAGLSALPTNKVFWKGLIDDATQAFMAERRKPHNRPRGAPLPPLHVNDLEALREHLLACIWNTLMLCSADQAAFQKAWPSLKQKLTAYANETINAQAHRRAEFDTEWLTHFIRVVEPLMKGPPDSPGRRKKEIEGMAPSERLALLETLLSSLATRPVEQVHPLLRSQSLTPAEWEERAERWELPPPRSPVTMRSLDAEEGEEEEE